MLPTHHHHSSKVRPRPRGRTPLIIIFVLLSYILYLRWTWPEESSPLNNRISATAASSSNRGNGIVMSTEKKGWAKAGLPPSSIYQLPLRPVPKGQMRIAVASMTTGETTYDHISISNKMQYVAARNYAIKIDLALPPGFEPLAFWHKLDIFEYLARTGDYDWIWWIDFDTVITNTSVKIEDIIADALRGESDPSSIDMLFTADCWPLNAGSMLMRVTPRLLQFLSLVWDCGASPKEPSEQDCIRNILESNAEWRRHAKWVPQTKLNAFPSEIPCFDKHKTSWAPGDFVIHFPGAWAHLKGKAAKDPYGVLMRKYYEWVDKKVLAGNERYQVLGEEPGTKDSVAPKDKDETKVAAQ